MRRKSTLRTADAIAYFDGNAAALARAIEIRKQAVSQWGEFVPLASAYALQEVTNGELKAKASPPQ